MSRLGRPEVIPPGETLLWRGRSLWVDDGSDVPAEVSVVLAAGGTRWASETPRGVRYVIGGGRPPAEFVAASDRIWLDVGDWRTLTANDILLVEVAW